MTETDSADVSGELQLDLTIDDILAARDAASPVVAAGGPDGALVKELAGLTAIDWPADQTADRIAAQVCAAASSHAAAGPRTAGPAILGRGVTGARSAARDAHAVPSRPLLSRPLRSGRLSWRAAGTVAAAIALIAGAVVLVTGSPGAGPRLAGTAKPGASQSGPAPASTGQPGTDTGPQSPRSFVSKINGAIPAMAAMAVVSQQGALRAVGAVPDNADSLTCVTRTVCYLNISTRSGGYIARTVDGGATWTAGVPLPFAPADRRCEGSCSGTGFQFDLTITCPAALTCMVPFGSDLLMTTDGFAHSWLQRVTSRSALVDFVSCPTTRRCAATITNARTGGHERFVYSADGGRTWAAARSPALAAGALVQQLRCDKAGACIAAVIGGTEPTGMTIAGLSSADGGKSWRLSPTYQQGDTQQYMISCGDARSCVVGSDDGSLAWLQVTAAGSVTVRVQQFPKGWAPNAEDVSCPTGRECFLETGNLSGIGPNDSSILATRDRGRTWASLGSPMDPAVPQFVATELSCPVRAGCIATGPVNRAGTKLIVVSDLGRSG